IALLRLAIELQQVLGERRGGRRRESYGNCNSEQGLLHCSVRLVVNCGEAILVLAPPPLAPFRFGSPQYCFMAGSTSCAHAAMPPSRFVTSRPKFWRRNSAAWKLR